MERYLINWNMQEAYKCGDGDYVLYADHVASHAFDEEKERVLFEDEMVCRGYSVQKFDSGDYINHSTRNEWSGWLACAKSRANQ